MRYALVLCLVVVSGACLSVRQEVSVAVNQTVSPEDWSSLYSEQSLAATFAVAHLNFQLPNGGISRTVSVAIDGQTIETCEVSETPADICVQDHRIEPGPHSIDIRVGYTDPQTGRSMGRFYNFFDRFVAGPREHLTLDLAAAFEYEDEPERYLERTGVRQIDAPACISLIEAIAYAPTCRPEQLEEAINLSEQAVEVCAWGRLAGGWREAAQHLLAEALENHFELPLIQCYAMREFNSGRNTIPPGMNRSWGHGAVDGGSWRWSRSVLPSSVSDETSPEARLEHLRQGLADLVPRVEVVTEVIEAFFDESNVPALRQRAMDQPFSYDPESPHGHRHWWIVSARWHDDEYDEYLAGRVARDRSIHCHDHGAVDSLLRYFLNESQLTETEWEAVQGMISRTPPMERVGIRCTHVFSPRVQCPVPLEDRIRWFGEWDCSEERSPGLRARAFRPRLRTGQANAISVELSAQLQQEFSACLENAR